MKEELTKTTLLELNKFIVDHGFIWVYPLIGLLILSSSVLSWLLATRKSSKEIDKLKAEIKKLNSETRKTIAETKEKIVNVFEHLNTFAEKYKVKNVEFGDCQYEFFFKKNMNDRDGALLAWKKLKSTFESGLVDSFGTYFRVYRETHKEDTEKYDEFISMELIPFLEVCSDFIHEASSDDIKNYVNNESLKIRRSTFEPMLKFALNNLPKENKETLNRMLLSLNNGLV